MEITHDRSSTVFVVTLVMVTVATISLVLRLISKWGVTRKTNADDYVIILAWVFAVGLSVAIMIGTQVGLGAPDTKIKSQWVITLKQCIYAFTVLYNPAIMATKTAILILYYRMAAAHMFFRYASIFTMAIVIIAGTVLTFLNIFQCRPVVAAFSDVDGTCIDIVALYLSSTPINVLTDLAILLLPLPFLTSLRIEFRQKIILVATFIVGGFVTVVDVVRIVFLQQALEEELLVSPSASITATSRPPNFTYYASFSLMWSAVEVSVGIMCCCVLVLKPLVVRIMPKLLHEAHSKQNCDGGLSEPLHLSNRLTTPRSSGSLRIARIPSFSTSPSTFAPATVAPTSSGFSDLNRTQSPISPLSVQPGLSRIPERSTSDEQGDDLDFFEMLAGEPPTSEGSGPPPESEGDGATARRISAPRRPTFVSERRSTMQTDTSQEPTKNFFDFVQLKSTVSLTHLSAKEAWWPTMFVSILFFLWGFGYGLIGALSVEIQNLLGYPPSHTIALHAVYWSGYFFGPLIVGYWVLTREGFKATFMTGLAIFATGALSFWPSSVLRSFPGFIVSNFIIALGLSCLEVAANPFISLAGPGELSEARLNFAQGIQGIGTIVSPIVAQIALFSGIQREDLVRVQWCYLAVALFVIFLAIVFYYVPLSEAGDDELEAMAVQRFENARLDPDQGVKPFGLRPRHLILWSGVLLMWCYDGSQESVAFFWTPIMANIKPNGLSSFWTLTIGRSVFTFGRFLTSALCYIGVPPRVLLGISFFGAFLTSLLALVLSEGNADLAMLMLYYFFEGPIFPTLFAMMMRGQGKHTKFAAAVTMMFNSGAAVWPSVVYGILHQHPASTARGAALLVVVILYGISTLWPAMISSSSVLRRWVDPKWSKCGGSGSVEHRHESPSSSHEKALITHLEVMPTPAGGTCGS